MNDKTQGIDSQYECDALLKIHKPISEQLYHTLYQDAKYVPFELSQSASYIHKVFPISFNYQYLQQLFLNECYLRDPLRAFKENYNRRRLISGDVEVRERKQRVQQYFDELDNDVNVHILWILTWIATLSYQDDNEKQFRLKQVIEVIRRINAKNVKLNVSTSLGDCVAGAV